MVIRAFADRNDSLCTIRAGTAENAEWLRSFLKDKLPELQVSTVTSLPEAHQHQFTVSCTPKIPVWKLQDALIECPKTRWVRMFSTRVSEKPHYLVQAYNLAAWITDQGEDKWWGVDGDPLLMSRLSFPCPPEELATELQRINRPLLVSDPDRVGEGAELTPEEISRLVETEELGVPCLNLSWQDSSVDWLLIEEDDEPLEA